IQEKGVILEVKRASPSKGDISPELDSYKTAMTYAQAGARAISCLTEKNYFKGTLQDLMNVCRAADDFEKETGKNPPAVLRKDFLTCVEDVEISYRAGADAVLLIARILSSEQILQMAKKAEELGLSVLIEVRQNEDLEKLSIVMQNVSHKNILCGVNSRDLKDFTIDMLIPAKMFSKIKKISPDARITFESGILSARSASFAADMGFNAILLGEAAARNPDKAKEFTAAFEKSAQNSETNKNGAMWIEYADRDFCEKKPFVKICGITNIDDALCAAKNGADFLGFIFWNKSKRNVGKESVLKIRQSLEENLKNGRIEKMPKLVGVIAGLDSEETEEALSLVNENVLDIIQVHTFETAVKFCADERFKNIPHYCAVNISCQDDIQKLDELNRLGEPRILVDAQSQNQIGGTGKQIDTEILLQIAKKYKLWIAGGISSQNVSELIKTFNPELIDISSSLEEQPGIKSHKKIGELFAVIK
ncbi:MAG: bifunctional indole-3-glycerol phosphate synthase/phosphoribosylanthranilate isomerase, partial [Treponema sp.]